MATNNYLFLMPNNSIITRSTFYSNLRVQKKTIFYDNCVEFSSKKIPKINVLRNSNRQVLDYIQRNLNIPKLTIVGGYSNKSTLEEFTNKYDTFQFVSKFNPDIIKLSLTHRMICDVLKIDPLIKYKIQKSIVDATFKNKALLDDLLSDTKLTKKERRIIYG
jgi:hypothetical protein